MLKVNLRETTTDQAGAPVIYADGVIQSIQQANGRVVPGSGCTNELHHVGGAIAGAETYEAGNITTDATVLPSGRLHLKAGRDIRLEPGFELQKGDYLRAEQVICYPPVGEWRFEYFLADHLGNNRILFSGLDGDGRIEPEGEVLQENHHYAFGLDMEGAWQDANASASDNRYRFNGMERNDDLGLDLAFYRSYDPTIGRWMQIDPMAEKYPGMSPYNGMGNNPIFYGDPMGDTLRVYVFDQGDRPQDDGTAGATYTADVYVYDDETGDLYGPYDGSSYPNSKSNSDNSTGYNTVDEGEHDYNNESGHKGGTKKGLNLVDSEGNRTASGTAPDGSATTMTYVNVHSGASDRGNHNSRGSAGCVTICPDDATSFFNNFDFSGGNTGNASGTIHVSRGNQANSAQTLKDKAKGRRGVVKLLRELELIDY